MTDKEVLRLDAGTWISLNKYSEVVDEYARAVDTHLQTCAELEKTKAALAESKRNKVCKKGLIQQLQSEIQLLTIEKTALLSMLVDQEIEMRQKDADENL